MRPPVVNRQAGLPPAASRAKTCPSSIAAAKTMGQTEKYGFVIHLSALLSMLILGLTWLVVALRNDIQPIFKKPSLLEYGLIALALLAACQRETTPTTSTPVDEPSITGLAAPEIDQPTAEAIRQLVEEVHDSVWTGVSGNGSEHTIDPTLRSRILS